MLYASILVILVLIGLLCYALSSNGKVAELGRLTFACALLALCFQFGTRAVALLR